MKRLAFLFVLLFTAPAHAVTLEQLDQRVEALQTQNEAMARILSDRGIHVPVLEVIKKPSHDNTAVLDVKRLAKVIEEDKSFQDDVSKVINRQDKKIGELAAEVEKLKK